jgi:putative tryptophan/tyrosine transport system substrate-binding protein
MQRREFITLVGGTAAAWPLMAGAQQSAKPVIGLLSASSSSAFADRTRAFRQGLKDTGFVEDQNVTTEYRWADGQSSRIPTLAAELVQRKVAVIFAFGSGEALAAKAATATIPIVYAGAADPVAIGLTASLNRPGGNVTGVTMASHALGSKRLDLLRQLVPRATVVAMLVNPNNPSADTEVKNMKESARGFGLQLFVVNASSPREIDTAIATVVQQRAAGLIIAGDPLWSSDNYRLVALVNRQAVPANYSIRDYVVAGGLMSYGTSFTDASRQAGIYVGRILKGEKPADLPVIQSAKFEFVLNLKTAKTLGLTVPPNLLALTDEVIE